ncbi:hypothetical protein BC829DRAFT_382197 [Chytridium lagenaria]|nr:hypothetical protein BC829DRAFT_382197 [Chytridium lagenaria]
MSAMFVFMLDLRFTPLSLALLSSQLLTYTPEIVFCFVEEFCFDLDALFYFTTYIPPRHSYPFDTLGFFRWYTRDFFLVLRFVFILRYLSLPF